jgi:uncharacterized protein YggE
MNTQTQIQITINDIAQIKELIDLACSRGAFRGAEAKTVGEIYEKLAAFLDAVIAQAQAEADQQGEVPND